MSLPKDKQRRRWRAPRSHMRATIAALLVAVSVTHAQPAKAEITVAMVAKIIGYIQQAYSLFSTASTIIGGSGPDLAARLSEIQATIINELRTQRNQQWRSQAQTAFDDFRILAVREPDDPSNESLWNEATGSNTQTALNQYSIIAADGLDAASAHQLAPMYYSLVTTWAGLQRMKGQIFPGFPAQWVAYQIYLRQAMAVGYKLIGAFTFVCWPGFNPGRGQYGSFPAFFSDQYWRSQLFDYLEAGRLYNVEPDGCGGDVSCFPAPSWEFGGCLSNACFPPTTAPEFTPERKARVRRIAYSSHFTQDPVVKIIGAAMREMLEKISGGDDPASESSTSLPEESGMLVDPWVDESSCADGPWGYPFP